MRLFQLTLCIQVHPEKVLNGTENNRHSDHGRKYFTLVLGLVVVAGFIGDASLAGVGVDFEVVSPITGARAPAVYHVLDREVGRWPHSSTFDIDTVLDKGT